MKTKHFFVILIVLLLLPLTTHAEDHYLYDVLKNEAESGGLAKEYTGEHHDSFTEEPTHKIYHWFGNDYEEADQILEKNNVLFGGYCWQMIRTTDTGGVKLLYSGRPSTTLEKENYTLLTNTGNFVWNNKKYTWDTIVPMTSNVEISFKIPSFEKYIVLIIFETESSINSSLKVSVDDVVKFSNSSKGYSHLLGTINNITNNNAIKIEYVGNTDENNNMKLSIKVMKINDVEGNSCDNYDSFQNYYASLENETKYNNKYNSLAYVGYMYNTNKAYEYQEGNSNSGVLFGNDIIYSNGMYTLIDTRTGSSSNHHYTCNNTTGTCEKVRYYFYNTQRYYELSGGKNISQLIDEMLYSDDVNKTDSIIKTTIENWYSNNLSDYSSYIEDTIYCNDRSIYDYGAFNPNGGLQHKELLFGSSELNQSLLCKNDTDKFSLSNNKAKLKYPIGLATVSEIDLIGNTNAMRTGNIYYLMTPKSFTNGNRYSVIFGMYETNNWYGSVTTNNNRVRPVISLNNTTKISSGNGSTIKPYTIKSKKYSNIIINNTENGNVITDTLNNIEENTKVIIVFQPNPGYKLLSVQIKDSFENEVIYQLTENDNEYSFIMPDSDVTITPVYEKIKSSINVEIINETEDLNVELNDVTSVEVGEEVDFKVKPIYGYVVNDITITGENGEEITYTEGDNPNEYTFTMPEYDVTITPSYERKKSKVIPKTNTPAKEFKIEVADAQAVVYEDEVKFTVIPEDSYEVTKIDIIDEDDNYIDYHKTEIKNEYQFKMPGTDVEITPYFEKANLVNPQTGIIKNLIILLVIVSLSTLLVLKKKSHHN
ncbi:MAG: hypothetical protein IJG68_00705 [Bacilli bacterium]|nr:hypothetical protein [Bacilli bacterium]